MRFRNSNADLVRLVRQGSSAVREWRQDNPGGLLNLDGAELNEVDLRQANLRGASLFRENLRDANLESADVTDADLRHASLCNANLQRVRGLQPGQLAGADLTSARLPESVDASRLVVPDDLREGSQYARHVMFWMLASCAFCLLTLSTTTEIKLLTQSSMLLLPLFNINVPLMGFFVMAPAALLGIFLYFQIYLQRQWDLLGSLPAVFPDGQAIDQKLPRWIMFGLVRRYFPQLRGCPPLFFAQYCLCHLLAWWSVPITCLIIWWRYTHRHHWNCSIWHAVAVVLAVHIALYSFAAASSVLRGTQRRWLVPLRYASTLAVGCGMWLLMHQAFHGQLADWNVGHRGDVCREVHGAVPHAALGPSCRRGLGTAMEMVAATARRPKAYPATCSRAAGTDAMPSAWGILCCGPC